MLIGTRCKIILEVDSPLHVFFIYTDVRPEVISAVEESVMDDQSCEKFFLFGNQIEDCLTRGFPDRLTTTLSPLSTSEDEPVGSL